jgi:DTW domain-containing protein YfiP
MEGLVLLDGSWSQAKALWWRNPWLLKLPRLVLHPREPSIYGKLRREPRREYLSTLEAIALALEALGEPSGTPEALRRLFRTLVQRARDASVPIAGSASDRRPRGPAPQGRAAQDPQAAALSGRHSVGRSSGSSPLLLDDPVPRE